MRVKKISDNTLKLRKVGLFMKKFMTILLALLMVCSMSVSAFAAEISTPVEISAGEESVQPYAFSRNYTQFYTIDSRVEVMRDVNWDIFNDTTVTVSFKSTEGPTKFSVEIWYKEDSATTWTYGKTQTLSLNGSMSCSIPENYTFIVMATPTSGSNGNATFQVSLS